MGYIFESEIITIMNTVRARTIGESDTIQLKDFLAAAIHPAIKAYFKAEVEKLLQQERQKEVRAKRFSYGLPEVAGLQRHIDILLINNYQFDQREFESLLDEAVHFEFNYLCRPQWTLQEFIFENRKAVPVSEVMRKFKYCVEYTYLAEIFRRYVIDRGLVEMGYEEFKKLIARVDKEVVATHSTAELVKLLNPLLEFIEVGMPEAVTTEAGPVLPINAAVVFFEDKGLDDIRKELETERDAKGRQVISLFDLERVVATVRNETPPIRVKKPQAESEQPPATSQPAAEKAAPEAQPVAVEAPVVTSSPVMIEPEPDLIDIYSLFTVKEQKVVVRKLFKKDEVEFRNALDRLNPIRTWKEASFVVDQIFTEQDVDPFSKEAILLTEKLFGRYEPIQEKS